MKSWLAEVQTGFEPLFFHIQADFQWQRPFSEGCGGWISEKAKNNLSQSYGRWIVGFHEPSPVPFLRSKRALQIGGMIVCFGLCPCQHNGTYTWNVSPATPTKKPAQILRFAESKNEPLSRKILGKAAQNALGKGTGPSNLPNTTVGIFLSRLKKWAQKSPEVVETSGLFALISFLVQLDGGDWRTRTVDLLRVKQAL